MTPPHDLDIAIVGAGAAGLMATISAARTAPRGSRIAALDGAPKIGAKILIAGGGRCNVTHDVVNPDDFFGAGRNQIAKVLRTFSVADTAAFFEELGVRLKTEPTGKLFPTTDRAQTVLDALLQAVADAGANILTSHRVKAVTKTPVGFLIRTADAELTSHRLILATGGLSLPKTGSDGAGYTLARSLGHSVTPTTPGLVPLILPPNHWLTKLSGISIDAVLTLASPSGKTIHRQPGSTLFTHFGLSGPAPMDISRHWIAAHAADPAVTLTANLTAHNHLDDADRWLRQQAEQRPKSTIAALLRGLLPERLADALIRHQAKVPLSTPLSQLSKDARRTVAQALFALPLPVLRDRGYLFAEVTAGGVPLDELNLSTMASRKCPGLYLCGEILNVDGRIGGYNFQWAWATGRLVGQYAARSLST